MVNKRISSSQTPYAGCPGEDMPKVGIFLDRSKVRVCLFTV